jgi:chromosome segregation ATPase
MAAGMTLFSLLVIAAPLTLYAAEQQHRENPIRKVVNMLTSMQAKVNEEAKSEQALFDKYMCYCQTSGGDLDASIKEGENKIESLTAALKSATEKKKQTEADLKEHQTSRADAKAAMAAATAMREKEAAAYAKFKADSDTNLAALAKAIPAIEGGMKGSFLQTTAALVLRRFAMEKAEMPDETRQELLSFLAGKNSDEYAPQSGQIVGILKQMEDEMAKGLDEATAAEEEAIKSYDALIAAKTKEVDALTAQIESEQTRIGDLGVEIAGMENDLEDTEQSLAEDQKFVAELASTCETKKKEWAEIQKVRQEELVALAETIKILNSDDALELFKKTLPSAASFMQKQVSSQTLRVQALKALRKGVHSRAMHLPARPELDLIALALSGKKIGFEKVIAMIDEMVANLKTEQLDDENKKEYCDKQLDLADDKKKELELSVSDSETAIEEMTGSISTLTEEIAALEAGIKKLDKSVAEATEQRKDENADYKELKQSDTAAKEVLLFAKNRLNKFYNPKLYKPPPQVEPAVFAQISMHRQRDAPPAPPETFKAYTKKSEDNAGVIAMMDLLVKDLDTELQEAEVNEKNSQEEYEALMAESATKRADDSKSMSDKTAAKAAQEEALQKEEDTKAATGKELMSTLEYIHSLHGECDWLLKYFDARKEARDGEIDALGKAKAVLSGADFSLMQTGRSLRGWF